MLFSVMPLDAENLRQCCEKAGGLGGPWPPPEIHHTDNLRCEHLLGRDDRRLSSKRVTLRMKTELQYKALPVSRPLEWGFAWGRGGGSVPTCALPIPIVFQRLALILHVVALDQEVSQHLPLLSLSPKSPHPPPLVFSIPPAPSSWVPLWAVKPCH